MKPIVIEIVARIVDGHVDPEPIGRTVAHTPAEAPARVASLLRRIAAELDGGAA